MSELEKAVGSDRRTFIKRLLIGSAFAAPVVSSFTMTGIGAVFGSSVPRQANGNQEPTTTTTTTTAPSEAGAGAAGAASPIESQPRFTG